MKLLILASHPVQYHAPVFREIARQLAERGDELLVVYLSDFSIQGYQDREFGQSIAWDEPLLNGYRSVILNPNQTKQPKGFWSLRAKGFPALLRQEKPDRLLIHTLIYKGAVTAAISAKFRKIPCTLRVETNDVAVPRQGWKTAARSLVYRLLYRLFDSAVAIGTLNRDHLVRHGIPANRIGMAYYCVPDRFADIPLDQKQSIRAKTRAALWIEPHRTVLLFSGKLIPKKNPGLILQAIAQLPTELQSRLAVFFLGAGELEPQLTAQAEPLENLTVKFLGFRNQQELPPFYLAADVLVLPSNRAGETWGLVVNEGLQAGLPFIATEAVGSTVDLGHLPAVQTIPIGDATALAQAIERMIGIDRQFDRYGEVMAQFSIAAAAKAIVDHLKG